MSINPWFDYMLDAAQRQVLFWDVLRQRGNQFNAHNAEATPNVLDFDFELVMSGSDLDRPVNYGLVRVVPPEGTVLDPKRQPVVIIDPRAGHGPGIGGFKADSEVGVAFREGHCCYVIGFAPEPLEGQTIEDVMKAEVAFIEHVASLHPECDQKPIVVGNCQGGWALMMLAAYRPDLCGPVVVAGAPLTYWAGVHGKNPMRYSGGWLGGTWLTRLTSDLGAGRFDGAWLVSNFEGMNPANTLWTKQYNLYSKIDSEPERYLDFEKYWGGFAILNGEEMQFIVDNLFVGNTLPTGGVTTTDGVKIDYRNITSPILVFCSWGDNITPPQQALDWILDIYENVDDIRAHGQTIVYCIHDDVGHLGIFVSGRVSKKEQTEFASNLDFINILPPGLYEAVLTPKTAETANADISPTDYVASFEPRDLDDIRALGGNDMEDERRFAAVKRISEINNSLYQAFAQPLVRSMSTKTSADLVQQWHPNRLAYRIFSDENPLMQGVKTAAETVRQSRVSLPDDNPYWQMQEDTSRAIETALDGFRDLRDAWIEQAFLLVFGNPVLQTVLGVDASRGPPRPAPGRDTEHRSRVKEQIAELEARMSQGGLREAFVRTVLYVNLPSGAADERRFAVFRSLVEAEGVEVHELKDTIREQFFMLLLDEPRAIATLPEIVGNDVEKQKELLSALKKVTAAGGKPEGERASRLTEIRKLLS